MRVATHTAKGSTRERNQDSLAVEHLVSGYYLAAVADGIGGLISGEVASELAVASVAAKLREFLKDEMDHGNEMRCLEASVGWANEFIYLKGFNKYGEPCMGTTLTAALIKGEHVWLAHVGDSRAYLVSGNEISQLTQDHSIVGEMVKNGNLTERQAMHHPKKNLLTNSVGTHRALRLDLTELQAKPGDILILCTDGLTTAVESVDIPAVTTLYASEEKFPELAKALGELAVKNGATDDVTVVAVWLGKEGDTA
ncbi:MAG TPA: serine/threonine-protein phosphatase [Firmicutes bacterium]|nr:serine/threonine-protein phosphatase [Bacillota bacterium]